MIVNISSLLDPNDNRSYLVLKAKLLRSLSNTPKSKNISNMTTYVQSTLGLDDDVMSILRKAIYYSTITYDTMYHLVINPNYKIKNYSLSSLVNLIEYGNLEIKGCKILSKIGGKQNVNSIL